MENILSHRHPDRDVTRDRKEMTLRQPKLLDHACCRAFDNSRTSMFGGHSGQL
jgi:hypothetical protein